MRGNLRVSPGRVGLARFASATTLVAVMLTSCSRASTTLNQPSASERRTAAIVAAASGYFVNGIGAGDWSLASRLSTGSLQKAADWLATQGISTSEEQRGTFTLHSMSVASITSSSASLSLDATQTVANYVTTYSGPVSMVNAGGGWKVANYLRDGRAASGAIFTNASGQASRSGVTVKVIGAQLESGHVDVWVQIYNRTPGSTLTWDQPIVIVDSSGRQRGHGFLFVSSADTTEPFTMLPQVSAFGDFLVDSVTLPLASRNFRLLVGATEHPASARIDLSIPVTLR